jgi:hypothetical protein
MLAGPLRPPARALLVCRSAQLRHEDLRSAERSDPELAFGFALTMTWSGVSTLSLSAKDPIDIDSAG